MPYKDKKQQQEYMKKYNKKHYAENIDYYRDKNKQLRKDLKQTIKDIKKNGQCKYCGESDSICLDFNHKNPKEKKFNISMAPNMRVTRKQLREEIEKCELVCANCHRKLHRNTLS